MWVKLGGKRTSATRLLVPDEQPLADAGGRSFSAKRRQFIRRWFGTTGINQQSSHSGKDRALYRKLASDGVRTESISGYDVVVIEREAMRVYVSSW